MITQMIYGVKLSIKVSQGSRISDLFYSGLDVKEHNIERWVVVLT